MPSFGQIVKRNQQGREPASGGLDLTKAPNDPIASPAPQPTFAEMQRQGRARPAPAVYTSAMQPQATPTAAPSPFTGQAGFAPGANPFVSGAGAGGNIGQAVQQSIFGLLQHPSAYGSDAVQRTYNALAGRIDDQFAQRNTGINEDSARRGLSDSSVRAGRLKDSNIEQRDAQTALADSLLSQQAQTYSSDLANAIATALGYGQQNFGQQLQTAQFNQNQQQIDWQQLMAILGYGG